MLSLRTAVAQWLRCCATNREVCGSISSALSSATVGVCVLYTVRINSSCEVCCDTLLFESETEWKNVKTQWYTYVHSTLLVRVSRRTKSTTGFTRVYDYRNRTSGWYKLTGPDVMFTLNVLPVTGHTPYFRQLKDVWNSAMTMVSCSWFI